MRLTNLQQLQGCSNNQVKNFSTVEKGRILNFTDILHEALLL